MFPRSPSEMSISPRRDGPRVEFLPVTANNHDRWRSRTAVHRHPPISAGLAMVWPGRGCSPTSTARRTGWCTRRAGGRARGGGISIDRPSWSSDARRQDPAARVSGANEEAPRRRAVEKVGSDGIADTSCWAGSRRSANRAAVRRTHGPCASTLVALHAGTSACRSHGTVDLRAIVRELLEGEVEAPTDDVAELRTLGGRARRVLREGAEGQLGGPGRGRSGQGARGGLHRAVADGWTPRRPRRAPRGMIPRVHTKTLLARLGVR